MLRAGYAINTIREDASTFATWGGNQGRTLTLNLDPDATPARTSARRAACSSAIRCRPRAAPTTPDLPARGRRRNSVNDFAPNLKVGYVQSWDIGFQRELTRDTVLEVRYIGNHGTDLWRTINLNEVNIFNNGFLSDSRRRQQSGPGDRCASPPSCSPPTEHVSYSGLAGQAPLPDHPDRASAANNDATTATQIAQGQAGALANGIATNTTRMTG